MEEKFVRRGFFFETFWANSSGGFEGSETFFFEKKFTSISFHLLFHRVSSRVLLLLSSSSLLFSLLLFFFSSLLLSSPLFSSLLLSSPLVSSRLLSSPLLSLLPSPFSSLLFSLSLSLSLSVSVFFLCLSLSLSLCLSVSVSVWCCVLWCCVLCCVVLCVWCGVVCGAAWHAEKTSACTFKTYPCVPAPCPHALPHAGVVGRFESTHGGFLDGHTERGGGRKEGRGEGGHRQFC